MLTTTTDQVKAKNKVQTQEGKRLKGAEVAQYFLDTGILFEVNRRFHHVIGDSLSVDTNHDTGQAEFIYDIPAEPTPTFPPETYKKGLGKWNNFWKTVGINRHLRRKKLLGFTTQGHADYQDDQKN